MFLAVTLDSFTNNTMTFKVVLVEIKYFSDKTNLEKLRIN